MKHWRVAVSVYVLSLTTASLLKNPVAADDRIVFPSTQWSHCDPKELGLNERLLRQFSENVGGDGCIVRNGYLVFRWGDVERHKDWASAAKPVLSTLLMLAVQEGRLKSIDAKVKDVGWDLSDKDSSMTFRHLANMVSGYAADEEPGSAWGYNDYAIQLYARSLERIFKQPLDQVIRQRLSALRFEDGVIFARAREQA